MNDSVQQTVDEPALLHAIEQAAHKIDATRDAALREYGLSSTKLDVLKYLVRADTPLSLSQLAERLTCGRSNITQLIDRLEQDQLVQRVPDPQDRRCMRATVTDHGRERYLMGIQAEAEVERALLADLPPEQQAHLATLLHRLQMNR